MMDLEIMNAFQFIQIILAVIVFCGLIMAYRSHKAVNRMIESGSKSDNDHYD
jgi:hypothetical protein